MALLKGFQAFLCNKQKMAASGMKMAANLLENGRDAGCQVAVFTAIFMENGRI